MVLANPKILVFDEIHQFNKGYCNKNKCRGGPHHRHKKTARKKDQVLLF
jgi:hypothetical protein